MSDEHKEITTTSVFARYARAKKRVIVSRGGTRSSKTYSGCQLAAFWLFYPDMLEAEYGCDLPKKGVWSFVRKTLPSLKASALRDFREIIENMGLAGVAKENKTDLTFIFEGRMVEFFSIDQPQKVRSRKRAILYAVEANEIDYKNDWQQLIFRTTHRAFLDFNPDDDEIWINTKLEHQRALTKKDVEVIVSTYKDNIFLPQELVEEIELTKTTDPELWQVYGLGQYGKITGLIYKETPNIIEAFPYDKVKTVLYGLDFGWHDPMVMVRIGINDLDLYIEEIYYKSHQLPSDLIAELDRLGVERNALIYADSARPGNIQEIFNAGWRGIKPSQKGKDSVGAGISVLKKYRWHVVAPSEKLLWERKRYKWATDKNGEVIRPESPQDGNDHALDALRYGVYTHTYQPTGENRSVVV